MTIEPICPHCCHKASAMCADSCADGPVVHCTRYTVEKAPSVLAAACSLCLGKPPAGEICRLCKAKGEPFIVGEEADGYSRPEFKVGCDCSAEALRAENQHLRAVLRHIADECDDDFARDLARKALEG